MICVSATGQEGKGHHHKRGDRGNRGHPMENMSK